MLRYKTETIPGLVALYDIRPGNGAGQFLQPRSPHGALEEMFLFVHISYICIVGRTGHGSASRGATEFLILVTYHY